MNPNKEQSMRHSTICGIIGLLASVAPLSASMANDNRAVVHDERHGVLHDSMFGTCVRTKWDTGQDECAPKIVVAPPPRREIAEADRTVYFEFNSARLMDSERQKLDSLTGILKSDKTIKDVRIGGFADRMGSTTYNRKLSEKRAKVIEKYLHDHEYLNTQLTKTRWFGKEYPVTNCPKKLKRQELIQCLQRDRRVVIEIDYIVQPDTAPAPQ